MKRVVKQLIPISALYLIWVLSLLSCTGEDLSNCEEGKPAQIRVAFSTGNFPVQIFTRSAIPVEDENRVHNLYVFVFNQDGSLSGRKYFGYDNIMGKVEGASTTGYVTLQATTGVKSIYLIANIDTDQPLANITKASLDAITTKQALLNMIVPYRTGKTTVMRTAGRLLMSGSGNFTVQSGGIAVNNTSIPLVRTCAKVEFTVNAGTGINFTPLRWRVLRAPNKVRLIADNTAANENGGVTGNTDFFDSEWVTFETSNSFTYYQEENRKAPINGGIPASITDPRARYNLRETQVKTPTGEGNAVTNGAYRYAHANATHVMVEGRIEMIDGGSKVFADVRYTVHLGYIGANANDFDCMRNKFYKYTLTINGVSEIIAEAQATDANVEPDSGAEGSSVINASKSFVFDSHYITCYVVVNKSLANNSAPYYVNTPFVQHGSGTNSDINWVKFKKNIAGSTAIQPYPGSTDPSLMNAEQLVVRIRQAVNTPYSMTNPEPGFFDVNGNAHFTTYIDEYYYETNPLTGAVVHWSEFVNKPDREMVLGGTYQQSPDGKSRYTSGAYLLKQKSIKSIYDVSSTRAAGFEVMDENWTTNGTVTSPNSSELYLNTGTSETQTGKGNNTAKDGWFNSCRDWELVSASSDPRSAGSWVTGVANTKWSNFVDPAAIIDVATQHGGGTYVLVGNGTVAPTKTATMTQNKQRYACLSRNRDLNGNGYIDKNEVRWYCPAIDQLGNVWIGTEGVIAKEDQMYHEPPSYYTNLIRYPYVLYLSSTSQGNDRSNPKILWSKEGGSVSSLAGPADGSWLPMPSTIGGTAYTWNKLPRQYYYNRCMRNLNADPSQQPDDILTIDSYNIITINTNGNSRINPSSYRNTTQNPQDGEYPYHTERTVINRPANRFQVAQNLLNNGTIYAWSQLRNASGATAINCSGYSDGSTLPAGSTAGRWRLPNQRELQMMSRMEIIGTISVGTGNIWAASDFMYNGAGNDLASRDRAFHGRNLSSGGLSLAADKTTVKNPVRCVRDVW